MASLEEIQQILTRIEADLPSLIQRSQISANQIVVGEGLSDISRRLGLVQAGEFRSGNGVEPGHGFSGVRIGYPPFSYSSVLWNIVGVENDVLQVGIRASDGKLLAGGGFVLLGSDGLRLLKDASGNPRLSFWDAAQTTRYYNIKMSALDLVIESVQQNGDISFKLKMTDGSSPAAKWSENSSADNQVLWEFPAASGGGLVRFGLDHTVEYLDSDGNGSVIMAFNSRNKAIDFNYRGMSDNNLFYIDVSSDALGFGASPASGYKVKIGGKTFMTDDLVLAAGASIILDDDLPMTNGWFPQSHTWTRASDTSFTVDGDETVLYRKGTKLAFTVDDSNTYAVVQSSSYSAGTDKTTVNLIPNSDYALTSGAVLEFPQVSYLERPDGFPDYFNFTITNPSDGAGTMTVTITATTLARWSPLASGVEVTIQFTATLAGTADDRVFIDAPVGVVDSNNYPGIAAILETPPTAVALGVAVGATNTLQFRKASGGNLTLGSVTFQFHGTYPY